MQAVFLLKRVERTALLAAYPLAEVAVLAQIFNIAAQTFNRGRFFLSLGDRALSPRSA
jgi:hypothetical protein